jgi:hypothetical protein
MKNFLIPSIKINSWGGLGSQLFAWALAIEIGDRFSKRKICLVFHTGGVTRRHQELSSLIPKYDEIVVEDFNQATANNQDPNSTLLKMLKVYTRQTLIKSGFVADANTDQDLKNITFFVLNIRGHYSYKELDTKIIKLILDRLISLGYVTVNENSSVKNVIHYRLGDLLILSSKSHLHPTQFQFALDNDVNDKDWTVFSDSPEIATAELHKAFPHLKFINGGEDVWDAISKSIYSEIFLGSNSKISIWILLFRSIVSPEKVNYMPISLKDNLEKIFGNRFTNAELLFY